jgi:AcrR family transcriptional regulator
VEAATALFVDQGCLATTIEDIADRAGVAVQTLYYVFGTKRNLLAARLDVSIAGDVEPVGTLERPWDDALRAKPDATCAAKATTPASNRRGSIYAAAAASQPASRRWHTSIRASRTRQSARPDSGPS